MFAIRPRFLSHPIGATPLTGNRRVAARKDTVLRARCRRTRASVLEALQRAARRPPPVRGPKWLRNRPRRSLGAAAAWRLR